MMKETDIFNDESLQNDIQDLVAIEQGVLRAHCPLPNLDAELEKIIGKEEEEPVVAETKDESPKEKRHPAMLRSLVSALVGAAAMLAIVFAWQWLKSDGTMNVNSLAMDATETGSGQNDEAVIQTAEGEMITLTLSDGTEVKLNSNSRLVYPHQFRKGKERKVHLEGEAFFQVKHNSKSPFIVDAGGVLTKDLGTTFNVRAYSSHDCKVTLVEGSVAVLAKGTKAKPVILTPGQQYSLGSEAVRPNINNVDTNETTAWADGVYYYHDQTLEHIVGDLAARYQMGVDFRNQQVKGVHLDFSTDRKGSLIDAVQLLNDLGIAKVSVKDGRLIVE